MSIGALTHLFDVLDGGFLVDVLAPAVEKLMAREDVVVRQLPVGGGELLVENEVVLDLLLVLLEHFLPTLHQLLVMLVVRRCTRCKQQYKCNLFPIHALHNHQQRALIRLPYSNKISTIILRVNTARHLNQ